MRVAPLARTARSRTARIASRSVRSIPVGSQSSTMSSLPTPAKAGAPSGARSRVGVDISYGNLQGNSIDGWQPRMRAKSLRLRVIDFLNIPAWAQGCFSCVQAHLAQSAERVLGKDEVSGSNPEVGSCG